MPDPNRATLPIPEGVITSALAGDNPFYTAADNREELARIGMVLKKPKVETAFTLRHHAHALLHIERARDTKATTYKELKVYTDKLVERLGEDMDVRTINEQTVADMYLWLKAKSWGNLTKRKAWRIFRRMVKYIYSVRLIELPRNLGDVKLAEVKGLSDRLRLYSLLALNCGMLGVDMASITWSELDMKKWRITRKRTKTGDHENVPEVSYKLWPCTVKLLKKYLSKHDTYVLTSMTNTLLWEAWIDDQGNPKKKDLISVQWRRKDHKIALKEFRSIGSTVIGDHKDYGRYASHYLGQTPMTIADRHYVAPSPTLFDEILLYVGKELGLV